MMGIRLTALVWAALLLGCEVTTNGESPGASPNYQQRDAEAVVALSDGGLAFGDSGEPLQALDFGADGMEGDDSMVTDGGSGTPPISDLGGIDGEASPDSDGGGAESQCDPCSTGFVCLPPIGRCVPDCRLEGNSCPERAPTCNQDTGTCIPSGRQPEGDGADLGGSDAGPVPDADELGPCGICEMGSVCAGDISRCVPDCRLDGQDCPGDRPVCEASSGLCLVGMAEGEAPADCAEACGRGAVCDPQIGECVRDCRSIIGRCPDDGSMCNRETGLCTL